MDEGKFYLSDEFKKLHAKWMDILKNSGFEEIEDIDPRFKEPYLKTWHSTNFFHLYTVEEFEEKQTYYRLASHFYWNYSGFKDEIEKEIWRMHADGISRRKISNALLKLNVKLSGSSVQIILSRLKKIMHSNDWDAQSSEMKAGDSEQHHQYKRDFKRYYL